MFWTCETFCEGFGRLFSGWLRLLMPNFYTLDCNNNNNNNNDINNNNNNNDNIAFLQFLKAPLIVNLKEKSTLPRARKIPFPPDKCAVYLLYVS